MGGLGALAGCSSGPTVGDGSGPSASATKSAVDTEPSGSATTTETTPAGPPPLATAPIAEGLFTALVIGSDTRNENQFLGNSDTIVIAQLTPARDRINLVSIARDSYVDGSKINAFYARGGPDRLQAVVSRLLVDLPIDATIETTFERFIGGIELLGGISVNNVHASDSMGPEYPAGVIQINGEDALTYVRERKGLPLGDFDRTQRGRAALSGILDKLHAIAVADLSAFNGLLPQLYGKVRATGLSLEQAAGLLPLLTNLSAVNITGVMLPVSHFATRGGASVVMINEGRTAELGNALRSGDLSGYVAAYGTETRAIN